VDYAKFSVDVPRRVKAQTFNLTNGADTVLRIVDGAGGVKAENDDATVPVPYQSRRCNRLVPVPVPYMGGLNNGERLASSVEFDAQPGTSYYARVTASLKGPSAGAGTMGSYGLQVTLGPPL
jgi:hypothetical protein